MRSETTPSVRHMNKGHSNWEYDRIAHAFLQKAPASVSAGATRYHNNELTRTIIQRRREKGPNKNRTVSDVPITAMEMHEAMRTAIQRHQETTLSMTTQDFPMTCMSRDQADIFLDMSLRMEKEVLPDYYASANGEEQHRQGFEKSFQRNRFCNVDVAAVVEDDSSLRDFVSMKLNISKSVY
jgi:hypothetical protein